ncbi:MAG: DUF2955 domain-containing protein [Telluria sp.]
MHRADKAVLRLASGLGLAVLLAYGLPMSLSFAVCVMATLVLCRQGPPIPLLKGALLAAGAGAVVAAGMLMVPLLEHYPLAGVMLTGVILYALFRPGGARIKPGSMILVIAITGIPVAGVSEQSLASELAKSFALGIGTGILVSSLAHALFPDPPAPPGEAPPPPASPAPDGWKALQATLVVLPVFVLALTNPSFYLAAIIKSVGLAQQAGTANASSAGRQLVGSTLVGAWIAALAWAGLSLRPNLMMLTLWVVLAALWCGARLFGVKPTSQPRSFWLNALLTMLILLGPAIEDSAAGKDVPRASAIRVTVFILLALYAWGTVWVLERWRAARTEAGPEPYEL